MFCCESATAALPADLNTNGQPGLADKEGINGKNDRCIADGDYFHSAKVNWIGFES